ncbi:hypothetical protein K2173_015977 [Erythroxylum novogranatense]|uniref:Uncharacterized protein n=1 Tax=Erythroxylum novogranatense TaxID=1862640 RepID=A0AAV8SFL6_9ROSI|nr:hypothetical protein K2173_015977 [Erythroxylum novogranatense]
MLPLSSAVILVIVRGPSNFILALATSFPIRGLHSLPHGPPAYDGHLAKRGRTRKRDEAASHLPPLSYNAALQGAPITAPSPGGSVWLEDDDIEVVKGDVQVSEADAPAPVPPVPPSPTSDSTTQGYGPWTQVQRRTPSQLPQRSTPANSRSYSQQLTVAQRDRGPLQSLGTRFSLLADHGDGRMEGDRHQDTPSSGASASVAHRFATESTVSPGPPQPKGLLFQAQWPPRQQKKKGLARGPNPTPSSAGASSPTPFRAKAHSGLIARIPAGPNHILQPTPLSNI